MDWLVERSSYEKSEDEWGLTRGRGMTEQQKHVWVQSTPACAEINHVMQELIDVQRNLSGQNKDLTNTRTKHEGYIHCSFSHG